MINNVSNNDSVMQVINAVEALAPNQSSCQQGAESTSLQDAMALLAGMLNNVQTASGQALADQTNQAAQISAALTKELQNNITHLQQQIQKQEDAEAKQKTRSKILEALEGIAGGILMCCGFEGTGAMLVTMSVLQATGVSNDMTSGLNKAFQDMGMSSDGAKLLTQALIFAVTTGVTFGMSVGSESTAAAKTLAAVASIGTGLTTASSLISDTIVVYFDNNSHGKTKQQQEQIEQIAQLVQTVIGALLALGGGIGAARLQPAGANTTTYAGKLCKFFADPRGQLWSQRVQSGNGILSGLSNAATDVKKGDTVKQIAALEANNLMTESALSRNNSQLSNTTDSLTTQIASQGQQMAALINAIQTDYVNAVPA